MYYTRPITVVVENTNKSGFKKKPNLSIKQVWFRLENKIIEKNSWNHLHSLSKWSFLTCSDHICNFWIFCSHKNSWNQLNNWKKQIIPDKITYNFFVLLPSDSLISIFGRSLQSDPGARGICCILACTNGFMSLQIWSLSIGWCCFPLIWNKWY